MTRPPARNPGAHTVTAEARAAAVADYRATGDPYYVVGARHNVSRSALHSWCNPHPDKPRGPFTWPEDEVAYVGGWEVRGGVRYPLAPERRSA